MNKGILILIIALLVFGFIYYQSQSIPRTYRTEVSQRLQGTARNANAFITEADLRHLPAPVQKYLRYMGVIGQTKLHNVRMVWEGAMRQGPKQGWIKFRFEQYNFFDKPARFFYIQGNMAGIPAVGLDSYRNGKGNMLIKLASLLTVVDAKDPKMDQAALVTYFNDICFFAPAALIDQRIRWEALDALKAKATFADSGHTISAILYFNEKGELMDFSTNDRYYSPTGKSYRQARWTTPTTWGRELNGVRVPAAGEAVWHFKEGDFCYAKLTRIKEIEFNCAGFK